jgi:hypothetical protein
LRLGGHCARRASLYHKFKHWEYELFLEIERQVEEIVKVNRNRRKKDKRPLVNIDDPDEINEWLDKKEVVIAVSGTISWKWEMGNPRNFTLY